MNTDTLTVVKLLASGRSVGFAATATGLSAEQVKDIGTEHGWPSGARLKTAAATLESTAVEAIPSREPEPPAPLHVARTPHPVAPAGPKVLTVDELARACRRSEYKRTQALGAKLTELAEKITAALRAEREQAEAKAKRTEEVVAAQAEVKRLTKALAAAKAKAAAAGAPGGARGGPRTCPECDVQFRSAQALGGHKRHEHATKTEETP